MRVSASIWLDGTFSFATADGRPLHIVPKDGDATVSYTYSLSRVVLGHWMESDVLEFRVWLADQSGAVWTAASRFTVHRFAELVRTNRFSPLDEAVDRIQASFDSCLALSEVGVDIDSRDSYTLELPDRSYAIYMKYVGLLFDLSYIEPDSNEFPFDSTPRVGVRLREGSLMEHRSFDPVPALVHTIHPTKLWQWNTAATSIEMAEVGEPGVWTDLPWSRPLVFEQTGEQALPQALVRVGPMSSIA